MEKAKCRMCGAQFVPCKGVAGIPPEQQPFNWRTICCSVACGSQFINSVLASRGLSNDVEAIDPAPSPPAAKPRRQAARKPIPKPVNDQTDHTNTAAEGAE